MSKNLSITVLTLAVLGLAPGCRQSPTESAPLFQEMPTQTTGVTFANNLKEDETFNLVEYLYFYNGGGVAVGDINNDGLADIYLSANQQSNKLYLNKGNWTFEDITEQAGVASPGSWKTGVTMADVNGDGLLDIYQCRLGDYKGIQGQNQLFINNGDQTFTERAAEYGLDFKGFSTQAAFLDMDLDGDLDMYLLNHSVHTERSYGRAGLRKYDDAKAGDRLYRNDQGKFRPITREAGIYSSQIGYGLGIGISDINTDGWPDIYISNDFNENDYLYLNTRDKTGKGPQFREVIQDAIGHTSRFSMGNDLADYNNDGLVDIISLDMLPNDEVVIKRSAGDDSYEIYNLKLQFGYGRQFTRNALQLNNGVSDSGLPSFSEIGQIAGVHATDWSWAPLFADYDNDGWKDLFISNGIRRRPNDMDYINFISNEEVREGLQNNPEISDQRLIDEMPDGAVPNYFFKNNGNLTFQDVSRAWGMRTPTLSNGSAYADLDNDGDLDLVVNHINQPASLYQNGTRTTQADTTNHYLHIALKGNSANTFGIGATVTVYAPGKQMLLENYLTRGFQSSVPPLLHFGLGKSSMIDSIRVIWPSGKTQRLANVNSNQRLELKESEATEEYTYARVAPQPILSQASTVFSFDFSHRENDFNDFNSAFLLPHKISREGTPITVADVDGDGLEDVYLGNAFGTPGSLFLQKKKGFIQSKQPAFEQAAPHEETNALFFDANGDGHPDLYIVTGSNEASQSKASLYDLLFINDGKGNFSTQPKRLPLFAQHGSVATAGDFDHDGDLDLFIGGRTIPAQYGKAPESYLLQNDGNGFFTDVTPSSLRNIGMVTDAQWAHLDKDSFPELVLVGEWMPITIFKNKSGKLDATAPLTLKHTSGWWKSLEVVDIDGDGDLDFLAGNQGENTRHRPTPELPLHLYAQDFDANGSLDPILAYTTSQGTFPLPTRDELIKQVPSFKKQFVKHQDYAGKTMEAILGQAVIQKSLHLQATLFSSVVVMQTGAYTFSVQKLPLSAQFTPIYALCTADINQDGKLDLLLGGNNFSASPYFGTYDAGKGLVLLGNGKGNFTPLGMQTSGINVPGEIRTIKSVATPEKPLFIFGINNDKPVFYTLNP